MAVLLTRPTPVNAASATRLRAAGFEVVLAPMLRFQAVAIPDDIASDAGALIATSAAALRAMADHPARPRLTSLPLFAVGAATAAAAREAGFKKIAVAEGDAVSLSALILDSVRRRRLKKSTPFGYLAGAHLSCDLATVLGGHGLRVTTHTVYRMAALPVLPEAAHAAFAADGIEAVLHYSRRSAAAFIEAARAAGVEIAALALPQCCISKAVADVLHEAGAQRIAVAHTPDEPALLEAVKRTLRPGQP
jgi:uroporphyrinogen-III synthase